MNKNENKYSEVKGLERHLYAPELNKLHFKKGGSFPTPGCTDIHKAYLHYLNH